MRVNDMNAYPAALKDTPYAVISITDIPVFIYSKNISKSTSDSAMALGAAGCIEKPNTIGMLTVVLRSVVSPLADTTHARSRGK